VDETPHHSCHTTYASKSYAHIQTFAGYIARASFSDFWPELRLAVTETSGSYRLYHLAITAPSVDESAPRIRSDF
jgi:hypothetical protein